MRIEEIDVLSGKMDELMKLFATKSVSYDPNDIPLSTLIENNNESIDVNFMLVGITLVTALIEGILILGHILVIPSKIINMGIPTTTPMEIIIRCPMNLRIVLKSL